tara:strand:- start:33 stop:653 length:621 start_codon:yes stop_codon:yes gene_type:complete
MDLDLTKVNKELRNEIPEKIIEWAVSVSKRPILTTNFGPYEAAILYACVKCKPDITVIWCDSGYNTDETYCHADELIARLKLNISVYLPLKSAAHRNAVIGSIPDVDDPGHPEFTEEVKLEPFRRAMAEHKTDLWLNNVRKGQTEFRDSLDIASKSSDGILKVSPFFYWPDEELSKYLDRNNLPNETNYFDPTKVLQHRECGLHTG